VEVIHLGGIETNSLLPLWPWGGAPGLQLRLPLLPIPHLFFTSRFRFTECRHMSIGGGEFLKTTISEATSGQQSFDTRRRAMNERRRAVPGGGDKRIWRYLRPALEHWREGRRFTG
jgi:hypothetical protein